MFSDLLLSRKKPCTTQSTTTAKWQAEAYCAHPHIPMPCRASLGCSSKGCLSDRACSRTTQLSRQERGQGRLGGTIASLDGSQNISTSKVGLVSPHGSSCCLSLQKGILPFFTLFLLQNLQWALWQHRCSTNSYLWVFFAPAAWCCHGNGHWLSVLDCHRKFLRSFWKKKRKKYHYSLNIFYGRIHHCHIWSSYMILVFFTHNNFLLTSLGSAFVFRLHGQVVNYANSPGPPELSTNSNGHALMKISPSLPCCRF